MSLNIIEAPATKNPCYQKATPMTAKGIVVHSTGANNPYLKRYVDAPDEVGVNRYNNTWNNPNASTCVHAFIGYDINEDVRVAHILPYNVACWGVGKGNKGSFNYDPTGHIQFEICEDGLTDSTYFNKIWEVATEYCAELCNEFNLNPLGDMVIVGHYEAHNLGYGSNHSDPGHWFSKHGKTMDDFRKVVKEKLNSIKGEETTTPPASSGEIKAGDIIDFAGGGVYSSANATTPTYSIDAGKYLVTQVYQLGKSKHPYSLNSADGKRIYGWVDADKVNKKEEVIKPSGSIEVGDIVQFTGGPHYSNANATVAAATPKAGPAKVSAISKGAKHPYHIIHTDSQSSVYGWVDANTIGAQVEDKPSEPEVNTCPYEEPTETVRPGHKGDSVKWVQWYLTHNGYSVDIDGIFGNDTEEKTRKFQLNQGIAVDGLVGKDTRARLKNPQAKKSNPYSEPTSNVSWAQRGNNVKWVQWELVEAGYDIEIDGAFGSATLAAVKDFQKKSGISVDGIVGKDTRAKLKAN